MSTFSKSRVLAEFRIRARPGLSLVRIGHMLLNVLIQAGVDSRRERSLEEMKWMPIQAVEIVQSNARTLNPTAA